MALQTCFTGTLQILPLQFSPALYSGRRITSLATQEYCLLMTLLEGIVEDNLE